MAVDVKNDEIDLIDVFLKVFYFFKKNILILVISLIVGSALGYSYKFLEKDYYKSEMLVESYTLSEELRINLIKQFQSLLDDKNYEILNVKTGLEVVDLKMVKEITFQTDGNRKDEDILFIKAQVWNSSVLPKLADGIQSFMNSFPYVKEEIVFFEENSQSLINDIKSFIIDSINPSTRNYYVNDEDNNEFFHNEVLDLLKESNKIEKELNYNMPFRVINDFIIYKNPVNNSKRNCAAGALILFLATIMALILIQINK